MNKNKEMELDNQKTVKTAFLNTFANGISLVIGMVMVPVISRVFPPEELGIATTFISTRNIAVILVTLAVYGYVYRAMIDLKNEKEKRDYIFSLTVFSTFTTIVFFLILFPFQNWVKEFLSWDSFLYYWLFVSIFCFALYSIADYYCIFHNKSRIVFAIVLCSGPVSQFLSVGLACFFPSRKYWGRVLGLDAAYVLITIILIVWLLMTGKKRFCLPHIKRTLSFSIPLIPHLLSQMVLTQCDLIMISSLTSSDKSGLYSMGHTIGFLAYTVMSQVMASWSPWVYRKIKEGNMTMVRTNAKFVFLLGSYLSIGLLTISPELVHVFLAQSYSPCVYIIPPLVLSMFFQFCYVFMYDLEYYYKKPNWIAISSAIAAVLNLILNFIFIPAYGYLAAGYTTMTSYFVLLLSSYCFVRRLGVSGIYPLRYFVKICVVVVSYTIFSMWCLDSLLVRYGVFLGMTVLILWGYRNMLAELFEKVLEWRKK